VYPNQSPSGRFKGPGFCKKIMATISDGAEVLIDFVKSGRLGMNSLKITAGAGLKESEIALKMLEKEGF
jgi:hypothetical protein